jgi:hypothetical protein
MGPDRPRHFEVEETTMTRSSWSSLLTLVAVALAVASTGPSRAEGALTITVGSVSGPVSGPFTWTFNAEITGTDTIVPGNFFRIYDFAGYIPGSVVAPAGWTASTQLSSPVPPPNVIVALGDSPTITNLIFTYTGSSTIVGPRLIAGFGASSEYGFAGAVEKNFVGRTTNAGNGVNVDTVGNVRVPSGQAVIPEPSSIVSIGLGALALGWFQARRRRHGA